MRAGCFEIGNEQAIVPSAGNRARDPTSLGSLTSTLITQCQSMLTTTLHFGPADHGRVVTDEELDVAKYESGYKYEIIYGRLYVSPAPNPPHDIFSNFVLQQFFEYETLRPDVVGYVTPQARVFVPTELASTVPEPDLAVYSEMPDDHWRDSEPFIVAEVLRGDDIDKDLFRNVGLYWDVPTIREYWVFDLRDDARRAKLIVYRRGSSDWEVTEFTGATPYETPLLPGLKLKLAMS